MYEIIFNHAIAQLNPTRKFTVNDVNVVSV